MEIREAKRSDWTAIEALVRSTRNHDYVTGAEIWLGIERLEDKLQALREEFDGVGSRFLGAFEGERAIGLILVHLPEPGRAWIDDLFIAPEARKSGLATELVSAAVPPEAEVACEVNRKDEASQELFRSLGFERVIETAIFRRRRPEE
jgi:ribosomal protein S18 acetylase RimI-like enzyme